MLRSGPIRGWKAALLLFAVGSALGAWSWGKWPDALVDFGRELYVPWRLAAGEDLYADIAWFNGPLSAWFNALAFRAFGVGLATLVWLNLALLAITTWLAWQLLARASDAGAATLACLVFLGVFAFGQTFPLGNYNFVTPYSHELTHGLLLALLGVWCLARADGPRSLAWAAASGVALGLAFLTKPEVFVAAAAGSLAALATAPLPSRARAAAVFLIGAALAPLLAGMCSRAAVLGAWPHVLDPELRAQTFYRFGMGLDDPTASVERMLRWAAFYAAALGVPLALGRWARGAAGRPAAVATFLAYAGLPLLARGRIDWRHLAAPWPLFLAALVVLAALHVARAARGGASEPRGAAATRLALAVLALALLGKMLLNARLEHYGFVLALPATLCLVVAAVRDFPDFLEQRGSRAGLVPAAVLGLIAAGVGHHLVETQRWYRLKTNPVGHGADAFLGAVRGRYAAEIVAEIERVARPDATLLVLPEGVMLNYLARRRNPTPYVNFMPPEMILFGEDAILESIRRAAPDFVALVHKDTSEYGARFFGRDYGERLARWVQQDYEEVRRVGAPPFVDERFGIALLRRRE